MANYAVIENDKVVNVIIADSKEIAETITGKVCVDITETTAGIDWDYIDGSFVDNRPKPEPIIENPAE